MPLCVELVTIGPTGQVPRVMDPQPASLDACSFVLQSGAEYIANPLLLTRTEALEIGISIAGLWVAVSVVKMVSRRI